MSFGVNIWLSKGVHEFIISYIWTVFISKNTTLTYMESYNYNFLFEHTLFEVPFLIRIASFSRNLSLVKTVHINSLHLSCLTWISFYIQLLTVRKKKWSRLSLSFALLICYLSKIYNQIESIMRPGCQLFCYFRF